MKLFFASIFLTFLVAANAKPTKKIPEGVYNMFSANNNQTGLLQGDIKIVDDNGVQLSLGSSNPSDRWPGGVVPYTISKRYSSAEIAVILSGMQLITAKTGGCITFRAKTRSDLYWIDITKGNGCYSYLGRVTSFTRGQTLSLGNGCVYIGTTVHEIMHALGYEHEQKRLDRDDYITVHYENMSPNLYSQFDKVAGDYHNTIYDVQSVMHYPVFAFSNNGQDTITINDPSQALPLAPWDHTYDTAMTAKDISAVLDYYECMKK